MSDPERRLEMRVRDRQDSWRKRLMMSRLIVLLIAVVVLAMPAAEHFWTWDHFLRGGGDFEFTLLGLLAFSGLVALIANQVSAVPLLVLLIAYRLKMPPFRRLLHWVMNRMPTAGVDVFFWVDRFRSLIPAMCAAPLRI